MGICQPLQVRCTTLQHKPTFMEPEMIKKMLLGAVAAVVLSAILAPAAHASPVDIGQIGFLKVIDTNGSLTGSMSGLTTNITNLNGDSIPGGAVSIAANFNTTPNALTMGNFSLTGTLRDSMMTILGM